MTDEGLCAIARGCPSLRHLGLGGCVRLTDLSTREVALRAGESLRHLDVSGCRRVSTAGTPAWPSAGWVYTLGAMVPVHVPREGGVDQDGDPMSAPAFSFGVMGLSRGAPSLAQPRFHERGISLTLMACSRDREREREEGDRKKNM